MKAEVENLMATFNTHREDLQKQLAQAEADKKAMADIHKTLYVHHLLVSHPC